MSRLQSGLGLRPGILRRGPFDRGETLRERVDPMDRWWIRPFIDTVFDFDQAEVAFGHLQVAWHVGKVVLDVWGRRLGLSRFVPGHWQGGAAGEPPSASFARRTRVSISRSRRVESIAGEAFDLS